MAIVVLQPRENLTKEGIKQAQEEHGAYIKITIDLTKKIVALGGEYHADAEKILIEKYGCESKNIVGGGYLVNSTQYLTSAMINLRPSLGNPSMELLDAKKRALFLKLAQQLFEHG